ncbi:hypothetical protein OB905_09615 [Halobacteria archaeon AArc-dxtr1]|nr:hypothetical protein [Halobacteria archaeon AArc-dxtr1]
MDRRDDEEVEVEIEPGSDDADRDRSRTTPGRPRGRDSDLADELGRISIQSTPEGYVRGRITDLEPVDATTVRLVVALPHGRSAVFALAKPIPWSRDFLFARLVEHLGYDAASVDHVVGETVYVARTDLEEEDGGTWADLREPVRAATALLGGRFGEPETGPTWRLVDPRELPDPDEETDSERSIAAVAAVAVALGALTAAAGAVVGATGALTVPVAAVLYALPGLVIALVGLAVLYERALETV